MINFNNAKTHFRRTLLAGVCLCLPLSAVAQNTFDPFAPDVSAPVAPTGLPTAPTPVAPALPLKPAPAPPPVSPQAAPQVIELPPARATTAPLPPSPTITPVEVTTPKAAPSPLSLEPAKPTVQAKPETPNLWERITSVLDDEKDKTPAPSKTVEPEEIIIEKVDDAPEAPKAPPVEVIVERPSQDLTQPKPVSQPAPAPQASAAQVIANDPTPVVSALPQPAFEVEADTQSTDPFAPASVAPTLPATVPEAPTLPSVIVQQPAAPTPSPIIVDAPVEAVVEQAQSAPVSKEPAPIEIVETETKPGLFERMGTWFEREEPATEVVEAPKVIEPEIVELSEPDTQPSSSFFQNLGNLFKSEPGVEDVVEPEQEPEVEVVEVAPEPITQETVVAEVVEQTGEDSTSFFQNLGNIFKSEPASESLSVETQEPEINIIEVEEETAINDIAALETPAPSDQASEGFFSNLRNIFSSEPAEPITSPEIIETEPVEIAAVVEPEIPPASIIENLAPKAPFDLETTAPALPVEAPRAVQKMSEPAPEPQAEPGLMDRLGSFFADETSEPESPQIALRREIIVESPSPAQAIPDQPGLFARMNSFFSDAFSDDEPASENQPVEEPVEMAAIPQSIAPVERVDEPAEPEPIPLDPRLVKAQLGLGTAIKLGQGDNDLSRDAACFTKNRGTVTFCMTPTKWPSSVGQHFDVSTHIYTGQQGIVQFDGNVATRLFTMFNRDGFKNVVAYHENKLGPATTQLVRNTRTIRRGIIENPVYIWRKINPEDGLTEVLEIREIADTHGSIPDLQRGSLRVYFEGARNIFSQASVLDFMGLEPGGS